MSRIDEVEDALRELGDTVEEVVATLTDQGCRGHRKASRSCPVYAYLSAHGVHAEGVDSHDVWFLDEGLERVWVAPPEAVRRFIERFDDGEFDEFGVVMSYPEYRRGDFWRKAGWIVIGAIIALAVAACGVGAAAGVYRLWTA